MFKRLMRSQIVQKALGWLLAAYMVLVKYTTRWHVEHFDKVETVVGTGEGVIALTWHSRFLMLNSAWKRQWQLPHVLISRSRDGALVSYTTQFLGLKTIRGSSKKAGSDKSKGGSHAVRLMHNALASGGCIVMTPDGPRGPRQRLGQGPLILAKLSGAPIVPCTFSVKNRIAFRSWDRFILPLPFGQGRIIWGTPVRIDANANDIQIEAARERIEAEMNALLIKADTALGHNPVRPEERK